jgi:hypothetical protein
VRYLTEGTPAPREVAKVTASLAGRASSGAGGLHENDRPLAAGFFVAPAKTSRRRTCRT